jgi:Tfp pilus assembly protein PilV
MLEVPRLSSRIGILLLTVGGLALAGCGTTNLSNATADADAQAAKIFADCNNQLRSGKFTSYRQAAACAENQVILTYAQAGYPYMDLVLFDLQERRVGAERIDYGTVQPDAVQHDIAELDQRLMAERERRIAARAGIGGAVPATRPEQLLAGLNSLGALPAAKATECFSVGSFTHCNNQPGSPR